MNAIFMNSEKWETDPHRLLRNFPDKIDSNRNDKYDDFPNLTITIHGKAQKKFCKNNKFKISAPS